MLAKCVLQKNINDHVCEFVICAKYLGPVDGSMGKNGHIGGWQPINRGRTII